MTISKLNVLLSAKCERVMRCVERHADYLNMFCHEIRKILNNSKCQCNEQLQYKSTDLQKTSQSLDIQQVYQILLNTDL